jgi:ubiquinone biosynthesis monooxygenase Coq7
MLRASTLMCWCCLAAAATTSPSSAACTGNEGALFVGANDTASVPCGCHMLSSLDSCPAGVRGCSCAFDTALIRAGKPFPPWLQDELRSNHAGETSAVGIYTGALWGLRTRAVLAAAFGRGDVNNKTAVADKAALYEERLMAFAEEHRVAEQHHLALFEQILEPAERSIFPAWGLSAQILGAMSTLWYPRAMYLTTESVESFVQAHYTHQIERLDTDPHHREHAPSVELRRMLLDILADEVHHKEDGRAGAVEGAEAPLPYLERMDQIWIWLVGVGSAIAGTVAKTL